MGEPSTALQVRPSGFCPLLDTARSKLKKEEDEKKGVKREAPTSSTPSPNKKLASELEKKVKALSGDTSLVKALKTVF